MRISTASLIAVLGLAVTGCGGGGSKSGVSASSGATLVRSGALAFVSVDSDLGSGQWQTANTLSHKFPGRGQALAQVKQELAKQHIDYERDIKPALGPEVDFAVVAGATPSDSSFAFLTKPDDADKLKQLVKKLNATDTSGKPAVYREVDGWYAVSQSQQMIDRVLKGGDKPLSDDGTFNDAIDALPSEALAKAYVAGSQLADLVRQASQQSGTGFDPSALGLDKIDYISASFSAEDDGVRLRGAVNGSGAKAFGSGNYTSKLMSGVPGDALAFLTFRGGGAVDQLQKLESNPQIGAVLSQLQGSLGVSFKDLLDLFANEVVFYVRPGTPLPEFSLLLQAPNEQKTLDTLDKLTTALTRSSLAQPCHSASEQDVSLKCIEIPPIAIRYGAFDGKVLVSTGLSPVSDYKSSGTKLADDADFKSAKAAAGLPGSTGGFLYVNLKNTIPLIETLIGFGGLDVPSEVTDNLAPLRSFLAWTGGSGDTRTVDVFLEIQ
jgi:uncharacterized protein DUF3352